MKKTARSLCAALILGLGGLSVHAYAETTINKLRANLHKTIPGADISLIKPSMVPGIYEVHADLEIFYVTANGEFAFMGPMLDLESRRDLTEESFSTIRRRIIPTIPKKEMIIFEPKGKTKYTATIFSDPTCEYSRKLHKNIQAYLDRGIRMRFVFFPRRGKDSDGWIEATNIWCAGNAQARRDALVASANRPPVWRPKINSCKNNPIDSQMLYGQLLQLKATPSFVNRKGDVVAGALSPDQLIDFLQYGKKPEGLKASGIQ